MCIYSNYFVSAVLCGAMWGLHSDGQNQRGHPEVDAPSVSQLKSNDNFNICSVHGSPSGPSGPRGQQSVCVRPTTAHVKVKGHGSLHPIENGCILCVSPRGIPGAMTLGDRYMPDFYWVVNDPLSANGQKTPSAKLLLERRRLPSQWTSRRSTCLH